MDSSTGMSYLQNQILHKIYEYVVSRHRFIKVPSIWDDVISSPVNLNIKYGKLYCTVYLLPALLFYFLGIFFKLCTYL